MEPFAPALGRMMQRSYRSLGEHPDRNARFEDPARLKAEYLAAGLPVLSIDTKKKALPGNFYRGGVIDTQETIRTNDHDFVSEGDGVLIPHGLDDVGRNEGFVHLNTGHDTTERARDSIALWWEQYGRGRYPQAKKLLLLCDGGGSNSAADIRLAAPLARLDGDKVRVVHTRNLPDRWQAITKRNRR